MKKLLPLLLFAAVPALGGGLRLFNPTAQPLEATVICDGAAARQAIAPQGIADFAGDCRAALATPLLVLHTDTVDDVDLQTLDAAATAECPTPALSLPLTGCRFGTAVAAVEPVPGATYAWAIEGGALLSGAGTERVLLSIGSGFTMKVTAVITSPSCGAQTAAGIMALRDPFSVKSLSAGSGGATGQPRTITWSYDNGVPSAQSLTISDLPSAIPLPVGARSYTYTPSLYGDKTVVLQASSTVGPAPGRTRAAGRGTASASNCTSVRAEAKFHVDCSTPVVRMEVPEATGVGIAFTARVKLAPGASAVWTIANGSPSTAAGDAVTIQPFGLGPVDIKVTVSADTCSASASAKVSVDASLGCATPPSAKLSIAPLDCDKGVITVNLTGVPPFSGTWSDGQPFTAAERSVERTVTKPGDYTIKSLHDALCSGQSNSVTYFPGPSATVSTNGVTCLTGGADSLAVLTFAGKPPFLGEWSDSVAFNTMSPRLERKITSPVDLTLKWFQDANCPGTITGHAGFGEQGTADLKLLSPTNGCLVFGDPITPYGTASVDLTGTPPFMISWSDGFEQVSSSSPVMRIFAPGAPGAVYPLTIKSARDAHCDLKILNGATSVGVIKAAPISGPAILCPGLNYNAAVPYDTPLPVNWRIDHGAIRSGQGTTAVVFTPDAAGNTPVNLYADITDPAVCAATATKPMKMYPNALPIQLSVQPSTINAGEQATITVQFNLVTTPSATVHVHAPDFSSGWMCVVNPICSVTFTYKKPGTVSIDATGNPNCDKLVSTHASATITVK